MVSTPCVGVALRRRCRGLGGLAAPRQVHLHRGADALFAVRREVAAGLLGDAVAGREAEAGALVVRLRREERLEDARLDRLAHAGARVAHREHHVLAGHHVGGLARVFVVEHHVRRLDHEPAAGGHRVAGVDDEVHQHLLELAAVHLDGADVRLGAHVDRDVLADQPAEHLVQLGDERVDVEERRFHELLPGEAEQLPGEAARGLAGAADLVERLPDRVIGRAGPPSSHPGPAEDHGQQVVEVVGDAAGQPADRLHLLGLAQLLLQLQALGDVFLDGDEVRDGARTCPATGVIALVLGIQGAILAAVGDLGVPRPPGEDRLPQRLIECPIVLAGLEESAVLAEQLRQRRSR